MSGRVVDRDRGMIALGQMFRDLKHGIGVSVGVKSGDPHLVRYAAVQEFGSAKAGVPERSYLRATFDTHIRKYEAQLRKITGVAVDAKWSPVFRRKLAGLGVNVSGDIVRLIRDPSAPHPELAEATVTKKIRKGSPSPTTPLVDDGDLARSIGWTVRDLKLEDSL